MVEDTEMIGLAEAAALARIPYQDAHRAMLVGKLRGQKKGQRWFVRLDDAQSYAKELAAGRRDPGFDPSRRAR